MSDDILVARSRLPASFAHFFGQIADTLDWDNTQWTALALRLDSANASPETLTLGEVVAAIAVTQQEAAR